MTVITADVRQAGGDPLAGRIEVSLPTAINYNGIVYLPQLTKFPLVSGQVSMTLVPSELSKVAYHFEVYREYTVPAVGVVGQPGYVPAYTASELEYTFDAVVPDYSTPITFSDLAQTTGVTADRLDQSIVHLAKRVIVEPSFWSNLNTNIFKPKGTFSSTGYYQLADVVFYQGGSYYCKSPTIIQGIAPSDTTNWQQLSAPGSNGTQVNGNDTAYDSIGWDGSLLVPTQNALRDVIVTLATQSQLSNKVDTTNGTLAGIPVLSGTIPAADNTSRPASTAWVQTLLATVSKAICPTGTVVAYPTVSPPTGWLVCDGAIVSRTTYANLFAILGTTYNTGGESGTTFRLPDLRGRTVVAPDSSTVQGSAGRLTTNNTLAGTGGAATVALSTAQMPSHNHTVSNTKVLDGSTLGNGTGTFDIPVGGSAGGGATRTFTMNSVSNTGSGSAHENMPPYQVLNYIIYTGN